MSRLSAAAAVRTSLHGVEFSAFVNSASGAREVAAWRADFPPGSVGVPHTMSAEEVLYVLGGRLEIEIDGVASTVEPGDAALVPAGAVLRVSNGTDSPASAWVTTRIGMTATMASGEAIAPPWAQ